MKLGTIGVILDDDDGRLFEVDTIWADDEMDVIAIDNDKDVRHVYPSQFWALIDPPNPLR
mgnify:CR=1 FL=1